jgi:hypothetical protein
MITHPLDYSVHSREFCLGLSCADQKQFHGELFRTHMEHKAQKVQFIFFVKNEDVLYACLGVIICAPAPKLR